MSIDVSELAFSGVYEITPRRFDDERGFFSETYNMHVNAQIGADLEWVQDNHSLTSQAGVLRGLHYQLPPRAQDKLVRVSRGRAFDVIADIRRQSPTFGRWLGIELSAEKWNQLFVPKGFAHGYLTLEPDTEVLYKVSDVYSPEHERTIRFDDQRLAIVWPLEGCQPVLSAKDQSAGSFRDADLPDTWKE
ncbi:MAG: dTDP-4-dehydrorhamnose 3,5-epimerase [Alphaproteobacteria bacterium]|nr:dTDP-4-dehydrorhamnose 3,5-epimerase [Alphaproteobacteria bacterium]